MLQATPTPVTGAAVLPFPRFSRSRPRQAARGLGSSPEFDAGFDAGLDFAFTLVRQLQARGQLVHLKGV
jgi:hypothetical protein